MIEAQEQLERLQTQSTSVDEAPQKRGPGRPPKALVSLEQAEQTLEAATEEHARLTQQRTEVQHHIRGIGHDYHFVDLERGVRRNGQLIAADIQAHIDPIRTVAQQQGLDLLATLPERQEHLQQELDLEVALGPALMATKGNAAPDVERAYARAKELCEQIGDSPQVFPVLRGLMMYYLNRGELQTTYRLGEQLLRLAQAQPDPAHLILAHYMLGLVLCWRGELASAQTHHTQALALYNHREHRRLALRYGVDLGVASHNCLALERWQLGYPDQALGHSHEAITLAQEVSHPHSLAYALVFAAYLHQFRREISAVHERAAAAMTLATEQEFVPWLARGTVLHGWGAAMRGQGEASMAEMRQGIAADLASGGNLYQPYCLGLLADAYGKVGDLEAGFNALEEALAVFGTTESRFYEADLYRLKGALILKQANPDASRAEACLQHALDIARAQQAKSWELRAATSLARLWHSHDKRQDAYDLLAPVYEWFTEGFDAADLIEAKQLLNELSADISPPAA